MSTFVIDASVAIHWLTEGDLQAKAIAILDLYAAQRIELIAPRQIMDEVSSTLSKLHRRKLLTAALAEKAFQKFEDRRPELVEPEGSHRRAFQLALRHQISFWDSLYLALAIERKADLLTADARFHRSMVRHYPYVRLLG